MRSAIAALAAAALLLGGVAFPGRTASAAEELGRGHITLGGPWITIRSLTVLLDEDSIDGFFLELEPEHWGETLAAEVVRNGSGFPYSLSMNFHGSQEGTFGRNWLGGCVGYVIDDQGELDLAADIDACTVPDGAVTVEMTAFWGADLDVAVLLL